MELRRNLTAINRLVFVSANVATHPALSSRAGRLVTVGPFHPSRGQRPGEGPGECRGWGSGVLQG